MRAQMTCIIFDVNQTEVFRLIFNENFLRQYVVNKNKDCFVYKRVYHFLITSQYSGFFALQKCDNVSTVKKK